MRTPEIVLDAHAELGEGALWDSRRQVLYWVDIQGKTFHRYDPATGTNDTFEIGQYVGTIVPCRNGDVLLAVHHGLARYNLDTRQLTLLCDPEGNQPSLRFNDGKCDPAGRFWAGTMPLASREPIANLFCLYPDGHVERKLTAVTVSNGIVWSRDNRTMYYIDTPRRIVDAFDYDLATGNITNRRTAISIPVEMGSPDGSTLDAEGMLWIAHFRGARVTRWNPQTGELLATIHLPTSNITSCAFGGPQLDRLYITSASIGLQQPEPQAGALFVVEPGVRGLPACEFAG